MTKCRVLTADNEVLVRLGVKAILHPLADTVICGEAADGREAILKAGELNPNIVIANPWLPGAHGVILCKRILERHPSQRILILGEFDSDRAIRELLHAGIKGLVLKSDPASEIVEAVRALQNGGPYFTTSVQSAILDGYLHPGMANNELIEECTTLTLREKEVTQLIMEGKQSKEVANVLGISPRTAATHRTNLMRKLGVHNAAQLTLYAASHDFMRIPTRTLGEIIPFPELASQITAKAAA